MKLVDMFSGAGLASMGFRNAGFRIAAALEINPVRCDVYERNLHVRPIQKSVMDVTASEILRAAGLRRGSRFCMVGCPPCQSFSKLADTRSTDALTDPRSRFVSRFAQLVTDMMPMAVVFENVSWMARGPGRTFFEGYLKRLEACGYRTRHDVINAADYGIPQNRRRIVAVSVREKFLNRDRAARLERFHQNECLKRHSVRDAISDLQPLQSGQADSADPLHSARQHGERVLEMIRHVPQDGGSRKDMPERLWLACHRRLKDGGAETSYGRMTWDAPSPTMTCRCTNPSSGRFIHPTQDRGITLREAARLQTIPDTFEFGRNSTGSVEEMIGDGVPVELAEWIGRRLALVLC